MQSTFRYDVHRGLAGDAYIDTGTLTFTDLEGKPGMSRILEFTVWDNPAYVRLSYDGENFGPDIELDQDDPPMQIPHAARAIEVRNVNGGSNSRYQLIGFW